MGRKLSKEDTRPAWIGGLAGVAGAIIAAAATIWVGSVKESAKERERAPIEESLLTPPTTPVQNTTTTTASGLPSTQNFDFELAFVESLTATVKYDSDPDTDRAGPLQADLCVLTSVGSYGGATKGCTLTKTAQGWLLVANGRKATSTCQAMCFDFRRRNS